MWNFGSAAVFRGFATMDWNQDGYVDLIARDLRGPARYYQSNCGHNKSLQVSLEQQGNNTSAIGGRIWVTDQQGVTRFRDISAGSSNIATSSPPVTYFGLGQESLVDIKVRWPDGEIDDIANVGTNQRIHIIRP